MNIQTDPLPSSDIDIYRAANLLTERYGEDASIHAPMSADAMMEKGDLDGFAVWRLIIKAVDELLANGPPASKKVH